MKKYTTEQIEFLRNNYPKFGRNYCAEQLKIDPRNIKHLAQRFGLIREPWKISAEQIKFVLSNYETMKVNEVCKKAGIAKHQFYNLISNRKIRIAKWTIFTPKEDSFIIENISLLSNDEIGKILNRTFYSIHARMQKLGVRRKPAEAIAIRRRIAGHTTYKPGNIPHNTKTDGEISIRPTNGLNYKFIRISVAKWKPLQIHNWEAANGPIPKGKVLKCIDGNTENCNPTNWELISRRDLLLKNNGCETLTDNYVLSTITKRDKELRADIVTQFPALIELKRNEILHRRQINEQHIKDSNTDRKWRPAHL